MRLLGTVVDGIAAESVRAERYYRAFARDKVSLVPHAVDDSWFEHMGRLSDRRLTRERLATPESATVLLYVGKLIEVKRVTDLIAAAAEVDEVTLWIVGAGAEEAALRRQAGGLEHRIKFLGFRNQTDLPAIYAAADVVVLPSESETFGMVVSEGAALGRTAVVSNACGVVESLVVHGVTGLVFEPRDVGGLTAALRTITDQDLRSTLSSRMVHQMEHWTAAVNAEAFTRFCVELARGYDK